MAAPFLPLDIFFDQQGGIFKMFAVISFVDKLKEVAGWLPLVNLFAV